MRRSACPVSRSVSFQKREESLVTVGGRTRGPKRNGALACRASVVIASWLSRLAARIVITPFLLLTAVAAAASGDWDTRMLARDPTGCPNVHPTLTWTTTEATGQLDQSIACAA